MSLESSEVKEKAEFNMAVSYLNRLNALLVAIDNARQAVDVSNWFHSLATLKAELSTEMGKPENEECNKQLINMNNIVIRVTNEARRSGYITLPSDEWALFNSFHEKMLSVMKEAGLLMKTMTDASKALFGS